jgi:hypothetical protein
MARFPRLRNYHQQIQVAPRLGITPRTGAKEPHLVRLHSLKQPHGNLVLCAMINHFPKAATRPAAKQASPKD